MVNELMVELSRWQFAATSLYHFIFVPLTLGISWLVFAMELVYVATDKVIYRDMAKFWGKLFGINFAIGVATGITLEFEFGTNWSNYSHYVGDIFGAPLALEGLMAFFLESTFIGLMFTGWNRFNKKTHLLITFLTALGSNLSAMWILIANGWMQFPEFAQFSPERLRMEMVDFWGLIFSPVAQAKFIHTVTAGYVAAAIFVIGVSAFLMLKRKSLQFAKRSMTIAIVFGLCAMGASGLSGDLSAILVTEHQPAKLAAMEAEYHTQEPPASWSVVAIPDEEAMDNILSIKVPALLGIIATHSLDQEVKGLRDIVAENALRIQSGLIANRALTQMRTNGPTDELLAVFKQHQADLGYGLLLVEHAQDPLNPTEDEIKAAARASVPPVWITYYAFRAMLALAGIVGLVFVIAGFFLWYKRDLHTRTKLLKYLVYSIPLPFIACEMGWIVAEVGRQPWAIQDVLPTFLATSTLSPWDVGISLLCFIGIYTVLLIIEMKLMVAAIKKGPTLTNPEPDGKGYPPLPPSPPSGGQSCKAEDSLTTSEQAVTCQCAEAKAGQEALSAETVVADKSEAVADNSEAKLAVDANEVKAEANEAKVEAVAENTEAKVEANEAKAETNEAKAESNEAKVEAQDVVLAKQETQANESLESEQNSSVEQKSSVAKKTKAQAEKAPVTKTRAKRTVQKAKVAKSDQDDASPDGGVLNAV